MLYIDRLAQCVLVATCLSASFPNGASEPSTVPGQTIASALLQGDTMNQIFSSDRVIDSECRDRTIVNTEVLERAIDPQFDAGRMVAGSWKERWYLDRCGTLVPYDVQYTADGKGGTSFTFLVGRASDTGKTPASESTGMNADLIQATLAGDLTHIDRLLAAGASLQAVDKHGRTPLKIAADKGAAATVTLLLNKGSDVNGMSGGESALHSAALRGHLDVIRVLLEHGANANQKGWQDISPLFRAVVSGKVESIELLLAYGADINARMKPNVVGQTPLMWAANSGNSEMVQCLLSNGADAKARDDDNKTVLASISYWCLSADVLKNLLALGVYNKSEVRKAFLVGSGIQGSCANEESFLDYVRFFMDNGVTVNQQSKDGDTALVMASRWGYANAVKWLLSQGADVSKSALEEAKSDDIRELLKDTKRRQH